MDQWCLGFLWRLRSLSILLTQTECLAMISVSGFVFYWKCVELKSEVHMHKLNVNEFNMLCLEEMLDICLQPYYTIQEETRGWCSLRGRTHKIFSVTVKTRTNLVWECVIFQEGHQYFCTTRCVNKMINYTYQNSPSSFICNSFLCSSALTDPHSGDLKNRERHVMSFWERNLKKRGNE